MEGKAGACGRSIGAGTLKFPTPARMTLLAARIGPWSAFVPATSMSGARGNTARNGLKLPLRFEITRGAVVFSCLGYGEEDLGAESRLKACTTPRTRCSDLA